MSHFPAIDACEERLTNRAVFWEFMAQEENRRRAEARAKWLKSWGLTEEDFEASPCDDCKAPRPGCGCNPGRE